MVVFVYAQSKNGTRTRGCLYLLKDILKAQNVFKTSMCYAIFKLVLMSKSLLSRTNGADDEPIQDN